MWAMLGSFLGRGVKRAVGQCSKAIDHAVASVVDQFNGALLAWFKSNGGTRCQVESHAMRCSSVKAQTAIGFSKVIVRPHLNGAIAGVLNHQCAGSPANIEVVLAFADD